MSFIYNLFYIFEDGLFELFITFLRNLFVAISSNFYSICLYFIIIFITFQYFIKFNVKLTNFYFIYLFYYLIYYIESLYSSNIFYAFLRVFKSSEEEFVSKISFLLFSNRVRTCGPILEWIDTFLLLFILSLKIYYCSRFINYFYISKKI